MIADQRRCVEASGRGVLTTVAMYEESDKASTLTYSSRLTRLPVTQHTPVHLPTMTNKNKDVIDMTAGLADLGASTHDFSSAKKRSRLESHSKSQQDTKKVKKVGLVGRPFHTSNREKHYRAIQYAGLLIEVS